MRTPAIVILVAALVVVAYFMGLYHPVEVSDAAGDGVAVPTGSQDAEPVPEPEEDGSVGGWLDDYYEYQGGHWVDTYHQNQGPVCFSAQEDGSTRILVTPETRPIPSSCLKVHESSAGFVVDQADYQIRVRSHFAVSTSFPCITADHGYYPVISENLGHLEPGEYEVHHGDMQLGTIQLPTAIEQANHYGACLQSAPREPAQE